MVLKELAKAAGSQPTGPGETSGGGAHGDGGGTQASMAADGRGPVPRSVPALEASAPHMVDHGWWKDAQAAGSQPTGPSETPVGGVHRGAE